MNQNFEIELNNLLIVAFPFNVFKEMTCYLQIKLGFLSAHLKGASK